jgi:hypothetical protein
MRVLKSRSANLEPDNTKRFYPRIEGGYSKIIRHGNSKRILVEVIPKMEREVFLEMMELPISQQYYLKMHKKI